VHGRAVRGRGGAAGQAEQVIPFVGVQTQRPGEGGQHRRGRLGAATAFQLDVVVDGGAGQVGHLVPAQARHPAAGTRREPDLGG